MRPISGRLARLGQLLHVPPVARCSAGAILQLHSEARDVAVARQGRRAEGKNARFGKGRELPVHARRVRGVQLGLLRSSQGSRPMNISAALGKFSELRML